MQRNQQLIRTKITKSQKPHIVYANEKLKTKLSQVNIPDDSQLQISNYQSGFKSLTRITAQRFDNIRINQSNNYLREETKGECQEDTTEIKTDELLTIFIKTVKVKKRKNIKE